MATEIGVVVARIETLAVDAIVNAANRELLPGGGVDGAIRRAAGPALTRHLNRRPPLPEGGAFLTPGFALPAKFVIHTAAPIWFATDPVDAKIAALAACYRSCLALAADARLGALAFPALGAGIYGWPIDVASRIAVETVRAAARGPAKVTFCCISEAVADEYRARLDA